VPEQSLEKIRKYIDKRLAEGNIDKELYRDYGQYMSEEQIGRAINIGIDLRDLCVCMQR